MMKRILTRLKNKLLYCIALMQTKWLKKIPKHSEYLFDGNHFKEILHSRCRCNFVPSKFPKGKLTIRYVQEGKEIHQLFQDLYKVTQ